jgi:hypothetical protein
MNERIEKLAELCGFRPSPSIYDRNQSFDIEKFAALVAAAERESVAASSKRDLTCVCGAVWEGEQMVHAPRKREWVGLTDEEVMVAAWKAGFDIHEDYDNDDDPEAMHWWSADGEVCDDSLLKLRDLIEAKLRGKNT